MTLLRDAVRSLRGSPGTSDPWNLLAVAGVLVLTAAMASHAPVRRALRIDPVTALRSE